MLLSGRLVQTILTSVLCGLIFLRLNTTQTGTWNRMGALFFIVLNYAFSSAIGTSEICKARAVFQASVS